MELFFGLFFIGFTIYIANTQQLKGENSKLLSALLLTIAALDILLGLLVLMTALAPISDAEPLSQSSALIFVGLSVLAGSLSIWLIVSYPARLYLEKRLIKPDSQFRLYRADSAVHTTAVVLALFQIVNTIGGYVLAGGLDGVADTIASGTVNEQLVMQLLNFTIYVVIALLGVGLYIRRDLAQTLIRLGLQKINGRSLIIGAIIGFILFWVQFGLSLLWTVVVSPEILEAQNAASEQIFMVFSSSIFAGLLLAITTGIGEELLFRGALQPIFGNVLTSIFFTLLHNQYTLTPAVLVLFGVSLSFGWIRQRYNTGAAMMAHFVYNLIPFILFWVLQETMPLP